MHGVIKRFMALPLPPRMGRVGDVSARCGQDLGIVHTITLSMLLSNGSPAGAETRPKERM